VLLCESLLSLEITADSALDLLNFAIFMSLPTLRSVALSTLLRNGGSEYAQCVKSSEDGSDTTGISPALADNSCQMEVVMGATPTRKVGDDHQQNNRETLEDEQDSNDYSSHESDYDDHDYGPSDDDDDDGDGGNGSLHLDSMSDAKDGSPGTGSRGHKRGGPRIESDVRVRRKQGSGQGSEIAVRKPKNRGSSKLASANSTSAASLHSDHSVGNSGNNDSQAINVLSNIVSSAFLTVFGAGIGPLSEAVSISSPANDTSSTPEAAANITGAAVVTGSAAGAGASAGTWSAETNESYSLNTASTESPAAFARRVDSSVDDDDFVDDILDNDYEEDSDDGFEDDFEEEDYNDHDKAVTSKEDEAEAARRRQQFLDRLLAEPRPHEEILNLLGLDGDTSSAADPDAAPTSLPLDFVDAATDEVVSTLREVGLHSRHVYFMDYWPHNAHSKDAFEIKNGSETDKLNEKPWALYSA
jgi:hypothetical protein